MERQDIVPIEGSKLLRTILREDVYASLKEYAENCSTGRGDWDFGVAIERLLELRSIMFEIETLKARVEELEMQQLEKEQTKEVNNNPYGLIGKNIGENNGKN